MSKKKSKKKQNSKKNLKKALNNNSLKNNSLKNDSLKENSSNKNSLNKNNSNKNSAKENTSKIVNINKITYSQLIHYQIIAVIILTIVFIILSVFYYLLVNYKVENVYVEGNQHYSAEEIKKMVEKGYFGDNSLFLSAKYVNKSVTGIPFIEKMDVDVLDKNSIKITVYEKTLAGYVEYLGKYMYFDKDGVIVESSNMKTVGIPLVTGLSFDHFVMYEPLPVKNENIFQNILNVTQMLNKYGIEPDKIHFDDKDNMTLYFDNVRVSLGSDNLLEEKIQRLNSIVPKLEGASGILRMDSYTTDSPDVTFIKDM